MYSDIKKLPVLLDHVLSTPWLSSYSYKVPQKSFWTKHYSTMIHTNMVYEGVIDHRSYTHNLSSCEIKAWIKGLNGIQTHDFCDTGAVLYQLSYQGNNRELLFERSQ